MDNKGTGLLPLTADPRDLEQHKILGAVPLLELPLDDFFVGEVIGIKDQGSKDFCGGYAGAAVAEDQEDVELNGDYPFMVAKRLLGGEAWKSWGISLRDICNVGVKIGFLEQEAYPFAHEEKDRDFLANPENWPQDLDMLAADHRKNSYFRADTGPYDLFDNLRASLWQNRVKKCSILAGCVWRYEWNEVKGGIVPKDYDQNGRGEGHAVKIIGQMIINGEPHLVVPNSWGPKYGDAGIFYFPREVVNREFKNFGGFSFNDMNKDTARIYQENGITVDTGQFYKLMKVIWNWIRSWFALK